MEGRQINSGFGDTRIERMKFSRVGEMMGAKKEAPNPKSVK
jgi:hypothetical protein